MRRGNAQHACVTAHICLIYAVPRGARALTPGLTSSGAGPGGATLASRRERLVCKGSKTRADKPRTKKTVTVSVRPSYQ